MTMTTFYYSSLFVHNPIKINNKKKNKYLFVNSYHEYDDLRGEKYDT
jgi:hypothetical protein